MEAEIWKEAGKYEVSNLGRVRNLKTKRELIGRQNGSSPYLSVPIRAEMYVGHTQMRVHILVAELFVENPMHYPYVKHVNGDLHDNRAENLVWTEEYELHRTKQNVVVDETGAHKICAQCGRDLPVSEFYMMKRYQRYQSYCKECGKKYQQARMKIINESPGLKRKWQEKQREKYYQRIEKLKNK